MNIRKRYTKVCLFLWVIGMCLCAHPINAQSVIPVPLKMEQGTGSFLLSEKTKLYTNIQGGEARLLESYLQALPVHLKKGKKKDTQNVLSLLITEKSEQLPSPESYTLSVTPERILIRATSGAGLFYGIQTLLQLSQPSGTGYSIASVEVQDSPRFAYRGLMLDVSRHFFSKEFVKKQIDALAFYKLNRLHLHLTDAAGWRLEIKKYPLLTKVGSKGNYHDPSAPAAFYTQEDIKDIVAYAAARHIMIVPEFDMPGHATAACRAYPELSGGGEGRWKDFTFHPCKEETFRFISDVLDELITLFPSPYIHIGGDEVHFGNQEWFTDPQIQQFIKDKQLMNETGLEQYFVRRVADIIAAKGKTMIGWDEIVDAGVSPDKAVVMWWRHDRRYQLLKALESGYRVIMTPRRPMYGDFVQYSTHNVGRYWDGYNPIEDVFSFPRSIEHLFKGYESQIMGMQYSLWTERVADVKRLDFMVFPRLVAAAEAAWTPAVRKDYSRFMRRLPFFLHWLDTKNIYYFDPFAPERRPEPTAPEKEDVLQNG